MTFCHARWETNGQLPSSAGGMKYIKPHNSNRDDYLYGTWDWLHPDMLFWDG